MKSLRPRDQDDDPGDGNGYTPRNPDVDFKGQRRSNQTHFSPTDREALMARKGMGKETKMCFGGHVLMENRSGLAVDVELTPARGTSEREAARLMLRRMRQRVHRHRCTLGADKGYDTYDFIAAVQGLKMVPHIARKESFWGSAVLAKLAPTPGYQVSQRKRKRVEEIFGWTKTVGGGRKLRYKGVDREPALGGDDHGSLQPGPNEQAGGGTRAMTGEDRVVGLQSPLGSPPRSVRDDQQSLHLPPKLRLTTSPNQFAPTSTPC